MNKINESINALKIKLKENEDLSSDEWNKYARENSYYSSVTIEAHVNVKNWAKLKKKLISNISETNLNREIEKVRKKLQQSIEETGLNSEKTRELSNQIDILINRYYKNNRSKKKGRYYEDGNFMNTMYNKSYEHLKILSREMEDFPSIVVWNKYAQKNSCLNSQSMEYVSGMNWHKLRDKIKNSITMKSN